MKEYDLIVVGTGSAMNVVEAAIQENPRIKVAVIDKDDPGGIYLTHRCMPSKILLYLAEVVEKTFGSLMPSEQYRHVIEHHYGISV